MRSGTRRHGARPILDWAQSRRCRTCARKWRAWRVSRLTSQVSGRYDLNQEINQSDAGDGVHAVTISGRVFSLTRLTVEGRCYRRRSTWEKRAAVRPRVRTGLLTGALRSWLAFGDRPTLTERAKRDGADYPAMERRGELRTYPGRTVPVKAFVADVRADLADAKVRGAYAGRVPRRGVARCAAVAVDGRTERDGAGRLGGSARVSARRTDWLADAAQQFKSRHRPSKSRRCRRDAQRQSGD